jgi:hypothetical protein
VGYLVLVFSSIMAWCILYLMLLMANPGYLLNKIKYYFMHENYDMSYFYNCCPKNIRKLFIGLLDNVIFDAML